MSSLKLFKLCLMAAVCALLVKDQYVKADGIGVTVVSATSSSSCAFMKDYSTLEAAIRSRIFLGDAEGTADLLRSRQLFSVAAGYTYRDNETCLVTQNEENRGQDPDIVAMRALAIHAERYPQNTLYLARAMVESFELECQCSLFTAQEKDEMVRNIREVLNDPEERETIINFGRESRDDVDDFVSTPRAIFVPPGDDDDDSSGRIVRLRPNIISNDDDDDDEPEGGIVFLRPPSGGGSESDADVEPPPIDEGGEYDPETEFEPSPDDDEEGGEYDPETEFEPLPDDDEEGGEYDPEVRERPPPSEGGAREDYDFDGYRRRLKVTESSPTNSFYCAYCEPRRACRRSGLRWC